MNKLVDDTNVKELRGREKATLLERFLRGSSDEISFAFIKDLHLAKDTESILLLRYCHNLLEKEIADLLNIDERTVRQRCVDARYGMEIAVIGRVMNTYRLQIKEHPVEITPIDVLKKSC